MGAVLLAVAVVGLGAGLAGGGGAQAAEAPGSVSAEVRRGEGAEETLPRIITYTYDPLGRLTSAAYSTGERFEYAYDGVGNRTVYTVTTPLAGTTVTTYTYDAANRLRLSVTSGRPVTYTWDARGNLIGDGTFTYTYNGAGRLVRATAVTATLIYTYTADGLRVGQAVNGSVMTYTWDLALGLAQVLATSDGARDVYGVGRIAEVRGGAWAYPLGDALGSVRQWTDASGAVTYAGGYAPYGEGLWQAGSTQSAWGYTGEWEDIHLSAIYLRARWYNPQIGGFLSRDPVEWNLPYLYANGNPVLYTDSTGLWPDWRGWFYGGYIEARVNVPLFGVATHGQEDWLDAAVKNVPALRRLYDELKRELMAGAFSSGTLRDLYAHTREKARVFLNDAFTCIHYPDLEYAHAALIVLAYIPANHDEDMAVWQRYPLFIPDGRINELGWDKAGHFFLNAFTAFEGKYSLEYYGQIEEFPEEYLGIAWMSSTMSWIIGSNNIAAIEADYFANTSVPYIDAGELTGDDAVLFNHLVTIGNAYELLTSLNHLPETLLGDSWIGQWIREHGSPYGNLQPKDLILLMLADRIVNGGRNIDALVRALLQHPREPERNEGLLDVGVYRDQVANRLGIQFGIQVFENPSVVPAIPYDVGKTGFECQKEVCYYRFP